MRADPGSVWQADCLVCRDHWHVHEQPYRCEECESPNIKTKQVSEMARLMSRTA